MLSIFRMLHESHLILAKLILEKVKRAHKAGALNEDASSQLNRLEHVVNGNFTAVKGSKTGITLAQTIIR